MPERAEEVARQAGTAGAEAVVRAVEDGTDTIAVPGELLAEEKDGGRVPPKSLHVRIMTMGVTEKIKLALRGNKDARLILVHDALKLIPRLVLLNPRISDGEVIAVARNRTADDELLRMIAERREWMRNYQVRLAIATNPKTPLALALRQVGTLTERDLRQIAKSKDVSQGVAVQARRILLAASTQR